MALAGCSQDTVSPIAAVATGGVAFAVETTGRTEIDSVVELRLDETAPAAGLHIRWLEVNDSRCPVGAECIWEGQVAVTLQVWRGSGKIEKAELTLRAGKNAAPVRVADRVLRLLSVNPHPRIGVTPRKEAYLATIEILALSAEAGDQTL